MSDTLIDVVCENLKSHMNDGNKADIKPKIASIILDTPTQYQCLQHRTSSTIDNHSINVIDMDKHVYASTDTLPRTFNPLNEIDVDQIGEIVDSTIETNSLVDDDPVFQSLT